MCHSYELNRVSTISGIARLTGHSREWVRCRRDNGVMPKIGSVDCYQWAEAEGKRMWVSGNPTLNDIKEMPKNAPKRREFEKMLQPIGEAFQEMWKPLGEMWKPLGEAHLRWIEWLRENYTLPSSINAFVYGCEVTGESLSKAEMRTPLNEIHKLLDSHKKGLEVLNKMHRAGWDEVRLESGQRHSKKRRAATEAFQAARKMSAVTSKFSYRKFAVFFKVSHSTAHRWLNRGHLTEFREAIIDLVERPTSKNPYDVDDDKTKRPKKLFIDPHQ